MPDTCTHQFTCLYCDAEKMERRERTGSELPVVKKPMDAMPLKGEAGSLLDRRANQGDRL